MKSTRIVLASVIAGLSALLMVGAAAAQETVRIGALHDLTGSLNIYGIQQSQALRLAVDQINAQGGVLGKPIEIVEYDTQSDLPKFTQYANTLIRRDQVPVMFGGLTSSSREAVRPIAHRAKVPYFYNALYEGGVCDRYNFLTGVTPSQQLSVLMQWAMENFGSRFYIMAPDYNFGTISAHWVKHYAQQYGGEVVGEDYLPLSQSDFGATIQKIQTSNPDVVVALPVGASQTSFFEQFAAAGLKDRIGVISTNYGSGNQQVVVSPDAGEGVISSQNYFMWIDTPQNDEFKALWEAKYGLREPIISEANDTWNAVHLWALAAEKAGSTEPEAVVDALESGISFDAPEGPITLEAGSHHLVHNVYIVRGDRQHGFEVVQTYEQVPPSYENEVCNLQEDEAVSMQFEPTLQQ